VALVGAQPARARAPARPRGEEGCGEVAPARARAPARPHGAGRMGGGTHGGELARCACRGAGASREEGAAPERRRRHDPAA
jgi:hypothetical protein